MSTIRYTLILLVLLTIVGCNELQGKRPPRAANEPKSIVNTDDKGLALQGYDPVAFFTDHKPVKGESDIHSTYKRATYYFASQDHQKLFDSDPARYEPQFGGYCGYAASIDKISPISVDYWEIIDGRLVLQHNQKAWDLWHKDRAGNLVKADSNWPGLVNRYGN